jgi:hypothetical protein
VFSGTVPHHENTLKISNWFVGLVRQLKRFDNYTCYDKRTCGLAESRRTRKTVLEAEIEKGNGRDDRSGLQ